MIDVGIIENLSIVCGAMTNAEGFPVAIDVYRGNTAGPATVSDQAEKLRKRFGFGRVFHAPPAPRQRFARPPPLQEKTLKLTRMIVPGS